MRIPLTFPLSILPHPRLLPTVPLPAHPLLVRQRSSLPYPAAAFFLPIQPRWDSASHPLSIPLIQRPEFLQPPAFPSRPLTVPFLPLFVPLLFSCSGHIALLHVAPHFPTVPTALSLFPRHNSGQFVRIHTLRCTVHFGALALLSILYILPHGRFSGTTY